MDNINFTGLYNIGAVITRLDNPNKILRANLLVNLTNDVKGKDLSEFREVLQRCKPDIGNCKFPQDDFVHIMTSAYDNKEYVPKLAVNRNILPVNNKTVPMFDYIAKLTRTIIKMNDAEFNKNRNSKLGYINDYLIPELKLNDIVSSFREFMNIYSCVIDPNTCRTVAKKINTDIFEQMVDWLK